MKPNAERLNPQPRRGAEEKKRVPRWDESYTPEADDDEPSQRSDKNPSIDVDEPQSRSLIHRPFQYLEF